MLARFRGFDFDLALATVGGAGAETGFISVEAECPIGGDGTGSESGDIDVIFDLYYSIESREKRFRFRFRIQVRESACEFGYKGSFDNMTIVVGEMYINSGLLDVECDNVVSWLEVVMRPRERGGVPRDESQTCTRGVGG